MKLWIDRARQQMNVDANVGKKYLDSLGDFLDRHPDHQFQRAEHQKFLGIYYYRKTNYDSAIWYYAQAANIYAKLDNELEKAKVLVNTSMVHNRRGTFKEAIEVATQSLGIFKKLDDKKGIGISLNIIGQVHFYTEDYENAVSYMRSYIDNAIAANDSVEIASGFANLGSVLTKLNDYDSSSFYYRKALAIQRRGNNLYSIGNSLQNIATNFQALGHLDSALQYYREAIAVYTKIGNKSGLSEATFNLGVVLSMKNDLRGANAQFHKALELANTIGEMPLRKTILLNLSANYEKLGNTTLAFNYYKQYDQVSDSILNEQNKNFIAEMNAKYESEQKEQQIALQESELQKRLSEIRLNYTVIATMAVVLVLLVVIFFLLRSRMKRKQVLLKRENELTVREALINATIQSQEAERKRFAQDLHDGMGQLISSLRLMVGTLNENASMDERLETVNKSEKLIDDMQREIRAIAFNLMPHTLIQHGLVPALKEMALRINASGKRRVTIASFETPERFTELQEISIYRIVQEWVNNILKHSAATQIDVQLVGHKEELTLTVEDDGMGFDAAILENGKGNGWKNIQSRAKLIHATVDIDSSTGRKGCTLVLKVPNVEDIREREGDSKIPSATDVH